MGRPPKYTLDELQDKVEQYFNTAEAPNKAGICVFLDINRSTYYEWLKEEHEFSNTIKRVESRIENWWVERLSKHACTGAIFYLKNAFKEDYKDRYEQDLTSKGEKLPVLVKFLDGKPENDRDTD